MMKMSKNGIFPKFGKKNESGTVPDQIAAVGCFWSYKCRVKKSGRLVV